MTMCPHWSSLHSQLSDAEQSRKQLQQSLEVIDRSHPHDDMDMNSLQGSLKRAQQEITRIQRTNQEQVRGQSSQNRESLSYSVRF